MASAPPRVKEVVTEPATFDEIAAGYDDDVTCYRDLRDETKDTLESFDQYIEFYAAMIEAGPTDIVYTDLNRNAVRSLKNMLLRSSRSGKRFPVISASELQYRIDSYQELGVDSVTPRKVVYTVIEYLLDDETHNVNVYRVLDQLLSDPPDDGAELIKLLAQARFVFATETLDSDNPALSLYLTELHEDIPDPVPDDDREPEELLAEADTKSFADPRKRTLVQAGLARQSEKDVLQEYLYLTASDIIERYRHQHRNSPWRGELQLAIRQFNSIQNLYQDELSSERLRRIRSYRQLALAELKSGGRWQSLRDPRDLPEPQFLSASNHYFKSAQAIKPVDPNRYIKYLSQAFRNQAIAVHHRELGSARGWATSRLIHERAIDLLTEYLSELDAEHRAVDQEEISETVVGAVGTHEFRKHRAAAVTAFEHRNTQKLAEHLGEAWEHLDATPTYQDTDLLKTLRSLSNALSLEKEGMHEQAHAQYQEIKNSAFEIKSRAAIVRIKHDVVQQNYEAAVSTAETEFEEGSPIISAVQLIVGESPSSPSIHPPLLKRVSAVDPEAKWWFTMLAYLASKQNRDSTFMRDLVLDTLLDL